ncbi:phosphotransferase enzyme family protein [Ohtaekwangia koreensis]|uniref:Ser/Thr protein kinase RdoA involved in Cpx stress response, MazF antagonist n=1 Tax=Ohtaekwangia koreensis TaxID=688867 RepID=A0A1T5LM89_9BACT|nr:aminoglycoside phosphotransferase family protein [Ohtaekwangia koreensis]SKC77070.1 Ser/Thr protein kinase RdoA involved in Cpx stress response, MazF antagonist [Ohtaekwangia koreensis]
MALDDIRRKFPLGTGKFQVEPIHAGYINQTYKLTGENSYILQRLNKNVFKHPETVAKNIRAAADYIYLHDPDYLFLSSIKTTSGDEMVYDDEGFPWRLFPYIANTITVNKVETEEEAFNAASGFARLTKKLAGSDLTLFQATIDRFHDLRWRYEQFDEALTRATPERKEEASNVIRTCQSYIYLVEKYRQVIASGDLSLRIMHNDTKINNILFDATTRKDICVIDLDTLMPGYFIYDLGDMIRTFVSPVDEEVKDVSQIVVRKNIYDALVKGYLSEMDSILTEKEKGLIEFSGQMMTYIMGLRMLTDFLNGDIYYQTTYPKQNLIRARNQLRLLDLLAGNG